MTNDEIQQLMANVDLNENGQVNYAEFINAALDKNKIITKEKLKIAFDYFDKVYYFFYFFRIKMALLLPMR